MNGKIGGEYWIQDGRVDFADGDVGEQNHEMIALNAIASEHSDNLLDYAEELGVDTERLDKYDENPFSVVSELIQGIHHALVEMGFAPVQTAAEMIKRLNINMEVYKMLGGGGDARLYMMKKEGWIAIRSNNIELFGYNEEKRKDLVSGVEEILDQEGIEESDEQIEFSLYDHKTGRSSDLTFADIKSESSFRPQTSPSTTYNKPLWVPPDRAKPMGSQSPVSMDAKTRSLVQTSESTRGFKAWLKENCEPFMVRRNWPSLTGEDGESRVRPALRRSRRERRR